jgi:hypothetical protein
MDKLNGNSGHVTSPTIPKESFFSHLRKRALDSAVRGMKCDFTMRYCKPPLPGVNNFIWPQTSTVVSSWSLQMSPWKWSDVGTDWLWEECSLILEGPLSTSSRCRRREDHRFVGGLQASLRGPRVDQEE